MFRQILDKMFNKCPPDALPDEELKVAIVKQCEENNLEGTDHFLSKVQQLYDMMDLSDGVMLLGDSYGGKTMATKTDNDRTKTDTNMLLSHFFNYNK